MKTLAQNLSLLTIHADFDFPYIPGMLAIRDPDGGPTPKRQVPTTSPRVASGPFADVTFGFWPITYETLEHSALTLRGIEPTASGGCRHPLQRSRTRPFWSSCSRH